MRRQARIKVKISILVFLVRGGVRGNERGIRLPFALSVKLLQDLGA